MEVKKAEKKRIRIKRFWLFYLLLVLALIICSVLFLNYVNDSLYLMEAAQPENYMKELLDSISSMKAAQLAEAVAFPETDKEQYKDFDSYAIERAQMLLESELTISGGIEHGKSVLYELFSDGVKVGNVTLSLHSEEVRLGLMSIPEWELDSIALEETAVFSYDITYPSTYRVLINGLGPDEFGSITSIGPIAGLEYEYEYVDTMPEMVKCHIDNLLKEPVITIYDNLGKEVPFEIINNTIAIEPVFASAEFPGELAAEINVLEIAETWSLFLTQDLSGPQYGLEKARAYFIRDSYFWDMAYAYATGVDITFVSNHTMDSFTNESVSEYIRYTDDCFSCVVYFEKNMTLSRSGDARTDIFNSRLFFVRYDDTDDGTDNPRWLISDMQAITSN